MEQEPVTDEQVQAFADDGVVCLRGAFGPDWIEPLRRGMDRALAGPSERRRIWDADDRGGTTTYDNQCWLHVPEYRDFAEHSPMAEIAGWLLGASAVNFFFDAVFVRTAGVRFRTPFHQDEPYWSVEGFDTCSAWMPLVPVARESALEFVRGSHRWDQRYRQENFGVLTGDDRDQVRYGVADDGRVPFPDIEGDRDAYEILGWDMEPGDVTVFNARIIHGGSGNLAPDRELKVFNTQWLGDDVRVAFRPEGMDPDHREVMEAAGLGHGDRITSDLYPELWRREPAPA
jgi:ectoine hydroxylase-related dioxygenase (phytanoyl-CoA dioxygenase family)